MSEDLKKIFADNLKKYLSVRDYTQADLARKMKVSSATASDWCNGNKMPRSDKLQSICNWLKIELQDLLTVANNDNRREPKTPCRIPVLGRVAAGIPIDAIENIIDWEEIPAEMGRNGEYFGLVIVGDSMEPRIYKGDIIIVRKQNDAESGDIVVATVNGDDATCKRYMKYQNSIALVSLNSKYPPMLFSKEEVRNMPIGIWGVVVEIRGKMKGI